VKERLTGAIILVALLVLVVPELLTGPIRSAPRVAALARETGEPPLRSYTIDLGDESHARGATTRASGPQQPAPLPSATSAESTAPAPSTAPGASSAPEAPGAAAAAPPAPVDTRREPPPVAPAAPRTGGSAPPTGRAAAAAASAAWVVQLGSFASRENAERLAQQVRSQGFQASVSQGSSGRRLYRVRVGAAHDRAGALALAQKLRALGHSGTVVPKPAGA